MKKTSSTSSVASVTASPSSRSVAIKQEFDESDRITDDSAHDKLELTPSLSVDDDVVTIHAKRVTIRNPKHHTVKRQTQPNSISSSSTSTSSSLSTTVLSTPTISRRAQRLQKQLATNFAEKYWGDS